MNKFLIISWSFRNKFPKKFINFCLKVGHSSNLKHWKSTSQEDNRPVTPVNVQTQHIAERERSTTVFVLISGTFMWSRLIYGRCLHLSDKFAYRSAHNNSFLTLRVIHKLKMAHISFVPRVRTRRNNSWKHGKNNSKDDILNLKNICSAEKP